ncbi:MAG TPA: sigma-54-dependent Fis family transcriptional regulator [Candidatus Cloacimonetes bacterium]|nr:sigma-54-dependent Fis family transcriptional regulator [Candidatus Cloacimonadota bacterium]HEX37258.1 sigma-54-dependent Fis family transcriptional regulator [Candidatus Cloacimonadota bacterium]
MKILIIEDDVSQNEILADFLGTKGFEVDTAFSGEEGLEKFYSHPVDVVISDYRMPGITGKKVLEEILKINPLTAVIIITAFSSVDNAVELLKLGAYDYIEKPIKLDMLLSKIKNARSYIKVEQESKEVHQTIDNDELPVTFIGNSPKIKEILSMVRRISLVNASVLISGESGTGKEVIADLIHQLSIRKDKNMIKVNCSAIPETLMESELFGHVKGAFTGAIRDRKGRFEEADGGILFLDEIGEISPMLQVKLLRTLRTMEFEPVGSSKTKKVDVRIIAATNKNLQTEVQLGHFREDLYYRLNVIPVFLPPLRERRQDIPDLVEYFLQEFAKERKVKITHGALMTLVHYSWEGNIRQLRNVIQRILALMITDTITRDDLPDEIINYNPSDTDILEQKTIADVEKKHIEKILEECKYNQLKAAHVLGVHRNTLSRKIKEYHINIQK